MEEAFECVCKNCGGCRVVVRQDEDSYEELEPSFCPFCAEPVDEFWMSELVTVD